MTPSHSKQTLFLLLLLCTLAISASAWGEPPIPDADTLLKKVGSRMGAAGFSAHFFQESPLKAIGIVETAEGQVWFRKPNRVRWEYNSPDRLYYITDGETLWIHSIDDAQVWIGSADAFFGKGGGARFLADVNTVGERFDTGLPESGDGAFRLSLTPKNPEDALQRVELTIDAVSFDITRVVSTAKTGEETTLVFSEFVRKVPELSLFSFEIPEGAMVSPLE